MSQPKYPDIEVKLSGENGNAYVIMGRVKRAMRKGGLSHAVIVSPLFSTPLSFPFPYLSPHPCRVHKRAVRDWHA